MQQIDEEKPKKFTINRFTQFPRIDFSINVLQMFNFFNMLSGILSLFLLVVNPLSYYLVKTLPS
jgi:hypothetical protein